MVTPLLLLALAADGGTLAAPDGGARGARPPRTCGDTPCETFSSSRAAFERVLASAPLVLAVGEVHEVEGAPRVKSALKRFSDELLPTLKGRATSLIAETWMTTGRCGEVEKKATAEVKKVTQRPDTTEDELTTMMGRAYDLGLVKHILLINCEEYRGMLDEQGELDADKSLRLVRRKVEEKALEVREKGEGAVSGRMLVLYGGALHNDLVPADGWADYSFGPSLTAELDGGYAELDLLVPEYIEKDEDLRKEPWFGAALKLARGGSTVLVTPHPNVWMLIFPAKRR